MTQPAKGDVTIVEPDRLQRTIARRSAEARATVPDFELSARLDLSGRAAPSTAALAHACAHALRDVPRANGSYRDGRYELYSRVNVGVSVMSADVYAIPTVFDADQKPIAAITDELEALRTRALAGELLAPELAGATFTLSDMSPLGVASAAPLLIPPQAAALAVGASEHTLTLTLTCDHRILYGDLAASFLRRVRARVEAGT